MPDNASKFSGLGFVGFANLFSAVLGGLFWLIIAPLLTVDVFGKINYDMAIPSIFGAIAILGLTTTVTIYTAKGNKKIKHEANFLVLISSIVISIPLFFVHWILPVFLITNNFYHMTTAQVLGVKSYKEFSVLMIGSRISQIVLSLLLYNLIGEVGVLLGYSLSFLIFSYRYFMNLPFSKPSISEIRLHWKFTTYNFASHISSVVYVFADKVLIGSLFGFSVLGFYAFGFQFLSALSFLPSSLSGFLLPEEASGAKTRKIKILGLIFSIFLAIFAFFLIPVLIESFFPYFGEAIPAARIMALLLFPVTVSTILNSQFLGAGNGKPVLVGMIIFIIIHFTGIVVLGNLYGLEGLAISLVGAHSVQSSYLWVVTKFSKKENID